MSSEYDSIGDSYTQIKTIPIMQYLEPSAFHAAIQPYLTGHAPVLDVACGTGFYSRLLLTWGASSTPRPVKIASSLSASATCARLALFEAPAPFDIVTGPWLLPYAASSTEMTAMWETVARNLRPGGVFRVLRAQDPGLLGIDLEYDADLLASEEGYRYTVTPQVDEAFSFHAYHLPNDVYEAAAKKARMTGEIEWRVMEVTEEARAAMGEGYWDRYVKEFMPKHPTCASSSHTFVKPSVRLICQASTSSTSPAGLESFSPKPPASEARASSAPTYDRFHHAGPPGLQPGTFDLVSAGWLLHYAPTRDDLVCTWANIARYLKPGGVFIGLVHAYTAVGDFTFGCQWKYISPLADGEGVKMTVEFDTEPKVEFDDWQHQRHVVEELAANAGLMNVAYRAPDVGILHEMELEAEARFCQLILSHSPNEIMRAVKA
ncbi:hypothetical protein B0H14DRAFT_3852248 [Mycena olivaceomarginata]|nr:hypothetical protein B0H14DRAFT_3852248 [Mycena olivaceomarginata]